MSDTNFVLTADAEFDDLPRTLRREREVREREKKERDAKLRADKDRDRVLREPASEEGGDSVPRAYRDTGLSAPRKDDFEAAADFPAATVKRLDVPFVHLMLFSLKAVVAAVPALFLLTAIMWGMGQIMKVLFPWLLQMQIYIQFPQ